ncbi:MAG: phosphoribosylglycinamide formyltransferase [Acidimicrobiia bacterium]
MRIGVLVSGSGVNLQAIIDAALPIAVVVSDRRDAFALERADAAGIPTIVVERSAWLPDRAAFTDAIVLALEPYEVDLVAMAGFMTILDPAIFAAYPGRVINTHPSLLPAFKGAHAVRDALAAGVTETGCTIHIATPDVDTGPILAQETVAVLPDDTETSLQERIKAIECALYPHVLAQWIKTGMAPTPAGNSR